MHQTNGKRWLRDSGFAEPVYDDFRPEIAEHNQKLTIATSFVGSIIMIFLTVAALVVPSIARAFPLYLTTALVFSALYGITKFLRPRNHAVVLLCSYAFLLMAFLFAVALDYIQKSTTATTVCVLLVALPLLIVDKPYREFIFFLCASVYFMLESVYLKQSPKASIDVLNAICFLCIGTFLGYRHNQMVLQSIRAQRMLEQQRDTDTLTNLYNKGAFKSRVEAFLKRKEGTAAMFIFDMDNFKYINDTYGHQAGDELLSKIGSLLAAMFRSGDYICRFGGDEFVVFMLYVDQRTVLAGKAEKILQGIEQVHISADENYRPHVCIGIATYPADGESFEELFQHADDAMYQVKKNGKNGFGFCRPCEERS